MDWLRMNTRDGMAWQGTKDGKETFVTYRNYTLTYFREWACATGLPWERWEAVWSEYWKD